MTVSDPRLVTPSQLSKRWSVNTQTLCNMRSSGKGPKYIKIGRLVRYKIADIIDYEKKNQIEVDF